MHQPILIHGLDDARAALTAAAALNSPLTLLSPPGTAAYGGAGWFRAVIETACAAQPGVAVTAVLDCADRPGLVLSAVRTGVRDIRFTGRPELAERLQAIATAAGACLHGSEAFPGPCLDLRGTADPVAACRNWLGGGPQTTNGVRETP